MARYLEEKEERKILKTYRDNDVYVINYYDYGCKRGCPPGTCDPLEEWISGPYCNQKIATLRFEYLKNKCDYKKRCISLETMECERIGNGRMILDNKHFVQKFINVLEDGTVDEDDTFVGRRF